MFPSGRRVQSGVVKASGGVCARLLRACPDNAAGRAPAPTRTLSAPSLILSTAARGGLGGYKRDLGISRDALSALENSYFCLLARLFCRSSGVRWCWPQ